MMRISPSCSPCNLNSEGFPLVNGPNVFGSYHPKQFSVQIIQRSFQKWGFIILRWRINWKMIEEISS